MEAPILSAAISGTLKVVLNKLAPLVIRKYSSIVGVKRDLEELQSLAEEINSWLERAGYIAMGNDPSLNWLKQLKEVAYDVDDVVDAFQLEAQKHEAQHYGDIVSKYLHKKAKSFVFQWKAASEIKTIKKRFSAIARQRIELGAIIANTLPSGCPVHHMNQITVKVPSLPIVDASSVVGRNEYKSTVISKLKETKDQQEIEIVSVIGLGGTGKTTLAKLVFSDEDTIRHLFEVRIWVHVSKECDDLVIIKKLFEAITKNNSEHHPLNHMSENITVALTGKTFLLVLDDVWIEDRIQWVQFREQLMVHLNSAAPTSKILLTTRSRRVAEVVESTHIFDLPLLSLDHSWQLFAHRFGATIPSEFEGVGKNIVIRCGGVPLAIIALACVLRDKERIEEWQAIRENCSLDIGDAQDGIFARLRLSYFYMAPHLKPCFAMCSLFPKGYKIGKEQLIDQWIAHGMVAVLDGVGYLEYTAEKYFNSLVQMSFLQDLDDENGIVTCRMHDLVHDLARSILDNEISVGVAKATTNFKKSYRYFNLIKEPPKLMPKNLFEKARAIYVAGFDNSIIGNGEAWRNSKHLRSLTVNATMDNGLTVNDATNNVSTQSLFTAILQMKNMKYLELVKLNCKALPEAISDIWSLQALHLTFSCLVELPKSLGKLQKLRVLNLSHCRSLKCLPDSIGECHMISRIDLSQCIELTVLPNSIGRNEKLRVLRLGNTKIERLPSSIPTLRNMECLDLHGCYQLVELPQGIGNLEKLHVLSLKGCTKLGGMPAGIGRLSQLQKLGLFVVGEGEKFARISELANTRIGEELIIRGISHEMDPNDAHIACLKEKTNLQRLDLQWRKYDGGAVKSKLEQVVHALDGLEPPRGIRSLKIRGYSGRQYALWMNDLAGGRVQGLPYFSLLREMRLYDLPNLKHLHGLVELPCLEELRLELMPSLESISGGPFPSLVKLQMRSLPRLGAVWMVAEKGGGCSNCTPHLEQVRVGSRISYLDIFDCHELNVKPYLPSSLHHLWLSGSEQLLQGSSLSPSLSNLKKLELQGMRGLGSGHGWELLQHMTALESLKIWDSYELTQLPESLGSLTSLRSLQVVSCPAIRALPESLGELQSLQVLNIEGCNNLSSLPQSMGRLTSLQVLQVETCNVLGQLPDCLWNLRSLRSILIIELPKLTHLPQSMCRLTSLEQFMISNCPGIKSLPEGIKGLTTLRRLSIVGCPDLARQCERRKGEDWHLISHIPCLRIS